MRPLDDRSGALPTHGRRMEAARPPTCRLYEPVHGSLRRGGVRPLDCRLHGCLWAAGGTAGLYAPPWDFRLYAPLSTPACRRQANKAALSVASQVARVGWQT